MKDKTITCIQCDKAFLFSTSEQEHFSLMGFDEPRRCPGCRKKKSKGEDPDAKRRHTNKKKHFRMKYEE
jgi:hypothetical protein